MRLHRGVHLRGEVRITGLIKKHLLALRRSGGSVIMPTSQTLPPAARRCLGDQLASATLVSVMESADLRNLCVLLRGHRDTHIEFGQGLGYQPLGMMQPTVLCD